MRVVERRDADDVCRHAGRGGAVEAERALVADRRHDDNAVFDEVVGGLRRGVLRPLQRAADAHVHDVGAVGPRALHGLEHDVGGRRPFAAEDAVGPEPDVGRDAFEDAVRADDAAHVCAVAVAVVGVVVGHGHGVVRRVRGVGVERVTDEVEALLHAAAATEAAAEIRVVVVDARVDDGDLYAAARQPELALGDVGARHLDGRHEIRDRARRFLGLLERDPDHRVHRLHARKRAQLRDLACRRAHGDAVPEVAIAVSARVPDAGARGGRVKARFFARERGEGRAFHRRRTCELDEPRI